MPRIDVQRVHPRMHLALAPTLHPAVRHVPLPVVLARVPVLLRRAPLQPAAPAPDRVHRLRMRAQRVVQVREHEQTHEPEAAPGDLRAHLRVEPAPGGEGGAVVVEGALEEVGAEREVGELDEDRAELFEYGEVVRETLEHREHSRAGLIVCVQCGTSVKYGKWAYRLEVTDLIG